MGASCSIVAAKQLSESQRLPKTCGTYVLLYVCLACVDMLCWRSANSCAVAICQHQSFCYSQHFASVSHPRDASYSVSAKQQQASTSCSAYAADDATANDAAANVGYDATSNTASAYARGGRRGR